MTRRTAWACAVLAGLTAACGDTKTPRTRARADASLSPVERDVQALGQAVFETVDRAVDYRGAHRGRPAPSLRQLGIDSLTPTMILRVVNVDREPVITAAFRRPQEHEIISCRGDSQVLEDAAVGGGQFTVMCTASSGAQRPIQVGATSP